MSSPRFPALTRDEWPKSEQRSAYDLTAQEAAATFGPPDQSPFEYKDPNGAFIGPFPFWLESPDAGLHAMQLYGKLATIPGLPPDARETAILVVGAHFGAEYELYAHSRASIEKLGMSVEVVEAIARGERPEGLTEGCGVAYDAARFLVTKPGKLSDELWERCIRAFGREGTIALVHYIGAYAYVSIILNAMDAPVPV